MPMWTALVLALLPAAAAVRLAKVEPRDAQIAAEARAKAKVTETDCATKHTPKMCEEKPGMGRYTAAAVLSTYREDIHWINEMPWSDNMSVIVHDRDDKRTHDTVKLHESRVVAEASERRVERYNSRRTHPVEFWHVPNIGDEASSFLGWIAHYYDQLPDVVFFIHGHRCSFHANFDMSIALPNIRQCFSPEQGYLDLNTYRHGAETQCQGTKHIAEHPIMGFGVKDFPALWKDLFQEEFGKMPTKFCWDSWAQFAVSRSNIRRHPKSFYERLLTGVVKHNTTMEFFWRAVFVKDALSWEKPLPKDKFGRDIKPEYHFTKEEELENARIVDEAGQTLW
mmetsp:Transcript_89551/g.278687  ORF Transcript_89551/g.278687 Transcript_89551/m.278687 type:complete len:338 (+) Transcript_89551:86-1099(+)